MISVSFKWLTPQGFLLMTSTASTAGMLQTFVKYPLPHHASRPGDDDLHVF